MTALAVFIAILPVAIIMFVFYYWVDQGPKEGFFWWGVSFLAGILIALISFYFESVIDAWVFENLADNFAPLFISFIEVSLVEEGLKWLPLVFIFQKYAKWDEYSDGVMFAVAIGMGFALVENILYGLDGGVGVSILRAFTAVPAHAVFGVLMGFFIARFRFEKERKKTFLFMSFLLPWLLHGLYDFFILQHYHEWLMILALVVLIGCLVLAIHLVRQARVGDKNIRE
jgi:RsiW-degrading membrane proteinase PrsW (M82 family)